MDLEIEREEKMGMWQRISELILSPRKAFEDLIRNPQYWGALIFVTLASIILTLPLIPKLKEFTLYTMQAAIKTNPALADPAAMTMAVNAAGIGAVVAAVLGPVMACILMAALLKLYNIFVGEKTGFKSLFTVSVYAYIPLLLASAIQMVLIVFTPAENFGSVSTSLKLLFPPESTGFWALFAAYIDPFVLWGLYLTALGGAVFMKTKVRQVGCYVFGLWFIFAVVVSIAGSFS